MYKAEKRSNPIWEIYSRRGWGVKILLPDGSSVLYDLSPDVSFV
jgi:hypothetical protein